MAPIKELVNKWTVSLQPTPAAYFTVEWEPPVFDDVPMPDGGTGGDPPLAANAHHVENLSTSLAAHTHGS